MLFVSFFAAIPDSIVESAKIDGANELVIFFRLAAPLSKPALEQQLIFGSSSGDIHIIKNTLDLIYQSNYIEKSISLGVSRLLLLRLKTILLSACKAEFEINQLGKSLLDFANDGGECSALHSFELLLQYYSGLCEKIRATQSIHSSELQNQLRTFVNENCFHPDMSLSFWRTNYEY